MGNTNSNPVVLTYPQRNLCGRRLQNDLPFATTPLTLCFEDTILVPAATWLLLALTLFLIPVLIGSFKAQRARKDVGQTVAPPRALQRYRFRALDGDGLINTPGVSSSSTFSSNHPKLATFASVVYVALLIAALLMNVLVVVRLYLANRGAGLYPFQLGGILLALILAHVPFPNETRPLVSLVVLTFWAASLALTAVKLDTLAKLMDVESRDDTEYLNADEKLDTAVIVGLYALAVLVESYRFLTIFRDTLRVRKEVHHAIGASSVSHDSTAVGVHEGEGGVKA